MEIIDTHFHPDSLIELELIKNNTLCSHEKIIEKSKKYFINKIFCISTEEKNFQEYINLSKKYEEYHFSIGIHPCQAKSINSQKVLDTLVSTINTCINEKNKIIGIGEIGLDFFREEDIKTKKEQISLFCRQIDIASLYNLPIIVHTREAKAETINILEQYKKNHLKGVIHAFNDDQESARNYIDLGLKLGIGGVITYKKNQSLREAVKYVGINNLLLETDGPFLPIHTMRGKINYPQYCYDIGLYLADLLSIPQDTLFHTIYQNTTTLFNL